MEVRYTITRDQKPTVDQIAMIDAAAERQQELLKQGRKNEVYDEDSPGTDPITTPERYAAMMRAVDERKRRIANKEPLLKVYS